MVSIISRPAPTRRLASCVLLGSASCLIATGTAAQTQPNAGSLLESVRPAPTFPGHDIGALPEAPVRPELKLDDQVKIAVKAIRISGAKAFPDDELQALVADALGRELTLNELNTIAQRITAHYREAGYLLARAYLPAQDIRDGNIEIAVIEGRLGKLHIENGSPLADDTITARLGDLREGQALDGGALERSLLLLNDLPGVDVKSTLKPGASVGTADLDIRLGTKSPYAGTVELDNYGNRYTGDLRLGGSLTAGNLTGLSDTLSLRALTADGLDYGRLAWQLPIGNAGTQVGAAWSDMRYKLGKEFSSLRAHGDASISSLYLLHPLQRSRTANINAQLNWDHKRLKDDVDSTATLSEKTVDVLTAGLSGDRLDGLFGGGLNTWNLAYSAGNLTLDAINRATDASGHRTAGNYDKFTLALSRTQALVNDLVLYGSLQAQQAGKNLDSSEKMSLGGAQAVRAYPQGEAPADDAVLATVELRYALAAAWQASAFYDVADGRLNHAPIAADSNNQRHISGAGLGLNYGVPGDLSVQMGVAWRTNAKPTSDIDRSPRVWVQAIQRF